MTTGQAMEVVGTVPGAFDSAAHGRVGLHVMYLDLGRGRADRAADLVE